MKKMNYRNVIVKGLVITLLGVLVVSCSSDSSEEMSTIIDTNTIVHEDGMIRVEFQLLNSAKQAVKTFKEGEQIVFNLSIFNKTDEKTEKVIPGNVISEDVFTVYSADSKSDNEVGKPWDGFGWGIPNQSQANMDCYIYQCSWLGANKVDEKGRPLDIEYESSHIGFFTTNPRKPLPKGRYYSEFVLHFNDGKTVTCYKDFCVI